MVNGRDTNTKKRGQMSIVETWEHLDSSNLGETWIEQQIAVKMTAVGADWTDQR